MRGLALFALALAAGCAAAPQDIRSMITPEAIAASTEPLLFFELSETGQQAIMSLTGQNGDVVTWSTADGRSISLQDGLMVATRGFGSDLMSADVSGTLQALAGSSEVYEKFLSFLDGENRTIIQTFICEMIGPNSDVIDSFGRQVSVKRWTEVCVSPNSEMTSTFWTLAEVMWRAEQAYTATLGTMATERLND
jgi:hypothetical protein